MDRALNGCVLRQVDIRAVADEAAVERDKRVGLDFRQSSDLVLEIRAAGAERLCQRLHGQPARKLAELAGARREVAVDKHDLARSLIAEAELTGVVGFD